MAKLPDFIKVPADFGPEGTDVRLVGVSADLKRGRVGRSVDLSLWSYIRRSVAGLSYKQYEAFIDFVMEQQQVQRVGKDRDKNITAHDARYDQLASRSDRVGTPFLGVDQYRLFKAATDVFLMMRVGALPGENVRRPGRVKTDPMDPLPNAGDGLDDGALKQARNANSEEESYDDLDVQASDDLPLTAEGLLPYLDAVLDNLGLPGRFSEKRNERRVDPLGRSLDDKLMRPPFLELIWSYWHEEGMLVQTMNAISLRFQNRRQPNGRDGLAGVNLDPLRPMSNLLWGYVQDEQHRLTIPRRVYEYDHHYGLRMEGRAIPPMQTVDSRSQFIAAFHELLYRACQFYREDDNTIVKADAFPILNSLKDVHVVLSEGAHNQYGDLPWTARGEMLQQMYLLGRDEIREFLGGRPSVVYPENWMDRVDSVKRLQGWADVSVIHFHDLAVFGEMLLLSARFTKWIDIFQSEEAATWARFFRPQIQGYVHAYHAVTGVDLSAETSSVQDKSYRDMLPSALMRQRLQEEIAQRGNRNGQIAGGQPLIASTANGSSPLARTNGTRRALPLPQRFGPGQR